MVSSNSQQYLSVPNDHQNISSTSNELSFTSTGSRNAHISELNKIYSESELNGALDTTN